MKIIFKKIMQIAIISLSSCCILTAQETAIRVKFKNEETLRQSLTPAFKNSLNLKSASKEVNLVPSYPNAKNPELKLYYDIKTSDNSTEITRTLQTENIFQK